MVCPILPFEWEVTMVDEKQNLELAVMLARQTLIELAQEGVPQDVLELLDEGEPEHGVRPGALRRALVKAMMEMRPSAPPSSSGPG
jgi:hypothetical protein